MFFLYYSLFAIYVAPKLWHGDADVALYLGAGALVAPPLVVAFALVRHLPAVAFLVGLVAFNLFLFVLVAHALNAFFSAIGYSSTTSLFHYIFYACCYSAYKFQLYYFYGARHSVIYVELENETNETDEEIGQPTPE